MNAVQFVVEIIFSSCSVLISLIVFFYSKKSSKTSFETGIYQLIQDAKINLDNQIRSILNELKSSDNQSKYIRDSISAPIETYLNALNDACALCWTSEINKKRFLLLFSDDIVTVFESSVYKDSLNIKNTNFIFLRKVYLEIIEKEL